MNAHRQPEPELLDREIPAPDVSALPALLRAEIDGQIATARAFPRSNADFIREATELVCLDEEIAESCIYALPRGKGADKKTIEGPSARFAELIQHCFGNNRAGARVVAEDKEFITAQGTYHDLEKNVQTVMEVKRRITDKYGKRFNSDMIGVTGNAAASIAHRNAVLKGIPKALWSVVYGRARAVVVGDVKTLSAKRGQALEWFAKVGITTEQIVAALEIGGVEDIGLDQLAYLAGIKTAIRDGSVSPEAAFAPEETESPVPAPTSKAAMGGMADALGKRNAQKRKQTAPVDDAGPTAEGVRAAMAKAETVDALDDAADLIRELPESDRQPLTEFYVERRDVLGQQ